MNNFNTNILTKVIQTKKKNKKIIKNHKIYEKNTNGNII